MTETTPDKLAPCPHDSDCGVYDKPKRNCDCSLLIAEARMLQTDEGCIIRQLADGLEHALSVIHTRTPSADDKYIVNHQENVRIVENLSNIVGIKHDQSADDTTARSYLKTLCERIELYAKDKTNYDFANVYQAFMDATVYLSKPAQSADDIRNAALEEAARRISWNSYGEYLGDQIRALQSKPMQTKDQPQTKE